MFTKTINCPHCKKGKLIYKRKLIEQYNLRQNFRGSLVLLTKTKRIKEDDSRAWLECSKCPECSETSPEMKQLLREQLEYDTETTAIDRVKLNLVLLKRNLDILRYSADTEKHTRIDHIDKLITNTEKELENE